MKIDHVIIDNLLFHEEGNDLDFKSEPYKFTNATDQEKSELLKDILAFANAWRRTDAFILTGVKEVKGQRSQIIGIEETLDDAKIQQFINSKTNSPILFSYQNITYENKTIGVLHIPCQQRPFYLKKDYGKLKKETIYLRRGSSTDIAKLDEIAQMGNSVFSSNTNNCPELELFFADIKKRVKLPNTYQTSSIILEAPPKDQIPDYELTRNHTQPHWMQFNLETANYSYYRELTDFIKEYYYITPIFLSVENSGNLVARDIRIELLISDPDSVISLLDDSNVTDVPRSSYSNLSLHQPAYPKTFTEPKQYLNCQKIEHSWLVEAGVHKVQPKSTAWLKLPFYFGATKPKEFTIKGSIFSDDLPEPSNKTLLIDHNVESRNVTLEGIKELERERWKTTPEYEEFKKRHKKILEK